MQVAYVDPKNERSSGVLEKAGITKLNEPSDIGDLVYVLDKPKEMKREIGRQERIQGSTSFGKLEL